MGNKYVNINYHYKLSCKKYLDMSPNKHALIFCSRQAPFLV